jgi:hypothetical protein
MTVVVNAVVGGVVLAFELPRGAGAAVVETGRCAFGELDALVSKGFAVGSPVKVGIHPGNDVAILHLVVDALFPPITFLGALEGFLLDEYALGRVIQVVGVAIVTMAFITVQVAVAAAFLRGLTVVITATWHDAERREKGSERQKLASVVVGAEPH